MYFLLFLKYCVLLLCYAAELSSLFVFNLFFCLYMIRRFNGHLRKKGISGHIKVDYEKKLLSIEVCCFSLCVSFESIQYYVIVEIEKAKLLKQK